MREILFRAKRMDNGEWIFGYLTKMWNTWYIQDSDHENLAYMVDKNTVCQYTGLTDKDGKKIWENDIILVCVVGHRNIKKHALMVEWETEKSAGFRLVNKLGYGYRIPGMNISDSEIIGNIFDKPELIEDGN